jgi:hypothetical protein
MSRTALRRTAVSWFIAGAVLVLLAVAGVDALRSSGDRASAPATRSTTAAEGTSRRPPCSSEQTDVTFEFRGRVATNVVRHVGGGECVLPYLSVVLTIDDLTGTRIFSSRRPSALWGVLAPGSVQDSHFRIPDAVPGCARGGPFQVRATVGSYSAHRELSANELACDAEYASRSGPG